MATRGEKPSEAAVSAERMANSASCSAFISTFTVVSLRK